VAIVSMNTDSMGPYILPTYMNVDCSDSEYEEWVLFEKLQQTRVWKHECDKAQELFDAGHVRFIDVSVPGEKGCTFCGVRLILTPSGMVRARDLFCKTFKRRFGEARPRSDGGFY